MYSCYFAIPFPFPSPHHPFYPCLLNLIPSLFSLYLFPLLRKCDQGRSNSSRLYGAQGGMLLCHIPNTQIHFFYFLLVHAHCTLYHLFDLTHCNRNKHTLLFWHLKFLWEKAPERLLWSMGSPCLRLKSFIICSTSSKST